MEIPQDSRHLDSIGSKIRRHELHSTKQIRIACLFASEISLNIFGSCWCFLFVFFLLFSLLSIYFPFSFGLYSAGSSLNTTQTQTQTPLTLDFLKRRSNAHKIRNLRQTMNWHREDLKTPSIKPLSTLANRSRWCRPRPRWTHRRIKQKVRLPQARPGFITKLASTLY